MANLTEKELTALEDLLSAEELTIKKYNMLQSHTQEQQLRSKLQIMASIHQKHFNTLYNHLK